MLDNIKYGPVLLLLIFVFIVTRPLTSRSRRRKPNIPAAQQVDYCAVLGVERDASPEEITRAWRRLVLLHHPDKRGLQAGNEPAYGSNLADSQHGSHGHLAGGSGNGADIRLINEARFVLSDPERRRQWQEAFTSEELSIQTRPAARTEPHIFREISLEAFEPHYGKRSSSTDRVQAVNMAFTSRASPSGPQDPSNEDEDPTYYTYPCRCSAQFVITRDDLEAGIDVVGCEGCGEWIRVGYEAVEEEEEL